MSCNSGFVLELERGGWVIRNHDFSFLWHDGTTRGIACVCAQDRFKEGFWPTELEALKFLTEWEKGLRPKSKLSREQIEEKVRMATNAISCLIDPDEEDLEMKARLRMMRWVLRLFTEEVEK